MVAGFGLGYGLGGCGLLVLQPGLLSRFKASSITYALGGFT